MIRPILYVNLPAVVYALDRHARTRRGEFATFICAPDLEEPQSGLSAFLNALVLINPTALTWICEDRWHLLGLCGLLVAALATGTAAADPELKLTDGQKLDELLRQLREVKAAAESLKDVRADLERLSKRLDNGSEVVNERIDRVRSAIRGLDDRIKQRKKLRMMEAHAKSEDVVPS